MISREVSKDLHKRAEELGINLEFRDISGQIRQISDEVLEALVKQLETLPDIKNPYIRTILIPENAKFFHTDFKDINLVRDAYLIGEEGKIIRITKFDLESHKVFVPPLEIGYYDLNVTIDYSLKDKEEEIGAVKTTKKLKKAPIPKPAEKEKKEEVKHLRYFVIVYPKRCYEDYSLRMGKRATGLTMQLYSLRSEKNWGIGDFYDLVLAVRYAGKNNIDFVGINPIHALFTSNPAHASPYSPSSRTWLNPIYIDVNYLSSFNQNPEAMAWYRKQLGNIQKLSSEKFVDYVEVWKLKREGLEMAFDYFLNSPRESENRELFIDFCKEYDRELHGFALFHLLDEYHHKAGGQVGDGWLVWPKEWQDPNSPDVIAFANTHAKELDFYKWLQWVAAVQWEEVQLETIKNNVKFGIYGDLAVGASRGGVDTWLNKDDYAMDISVGAPPDPLGPAGQNWGLPPLHPVVAQQTGYKAFIRLLKANMKLFGILRLDHVMLLWRLWWILPNSGADKGAYVNYPHDVLCAILTVESVRNRCMVIGEDLGTVPEGMREKLKEIGVFSYSVMYFMREGENFLPPTEYPEQAITVVSTHDVAPLSGYWVANDISMMRRLGVFNDDAAEEYLLKERERDKNAIFRALKSAFCLPLNVREVPTSITHDIRRGIHSFVAQTLSKLCAVQIENLLNVRDNFNYPGISFGYPNWATKLPVPTVQWEYNTYLTDLINLIEEQRMKKDTQNVYPPISDEEWGTINRLFDACEDNPFGYLGKHELPNGQFVIRTLQPNAENVSVISKEGKNLAKLQQLDERGLFAGILPKNVPNYRLAVTYYNNPETFVIEDAYRFGSLLGELDSWLLGQGNHLRPYEYLGAHFKEVDGVKGVNFAVWAPNAKRVSVVGEFNQWDGRKHQMRRQGDIGIWDIFIPDVKENALYKFELLDSKGNLRTKADPYAFGAELRPGTASLVRGLPDKVSGNQFKSGSNNPDKPISIYEVHLGSWKRGEDNRFLTYKEMAEQLIPYVKDMGFTHIELMPISEYPFDGSWGYQATGLYAPTSRYGSPQELKDFIKAAHDAGLQVILDWVIGHFPTDEYGLQRFDGTALYEHEDPKEGFHKDWNTFIYNFGRTEVANFLRGNALYWIERFGFDGIRVDAVASMVYRDYSRKEGEWIPNRYGGKENIEAIEFLRRTNKMLQKEAPEVVEIAEESTSFGGVTHQEGLAFSYKWNMGWMNDTLRYMKEDPIHRKYHHNQMTFGMIYQYSENFVLPISHDEVVHGKCSMLDKMPGDCWQKFANLRAYYGYMWGYPGKKLLFMGCEFAQGAEWNFQGSLDWHLLEEDNGGWHNGMQRWVKDLNKIYKEYPALYQRDQDPGGFDWLIVDDSDSSIFVYSRYDHSGNEVIVISNFTPIPRETYQFGVYRGGRYRVILNSDDGNYNGSGYSQTMEYIAKNEGSHGKPFSLTVSVPPLATVFLYRQE